MSARATTIERPSSLETHRDEDGNLRVRLRGSWTVEAGGVALEEARKTMAGAARVTLDGEALEGWDSVLVQAILVFRREARDRGLPFDLIGIDPGAVRLADLAEAVPEKDDARRQEARSDFLTGIGLAAAQVSANLRSTCLLYTSDAADEYNPV